MALQAGFAGVVGPFQTVFERAIEEWNRISGAHEEIQRLIATMKQLKSAMDDAEEKQICNIGEVKVWLLKLKQVVFDAEDLVDEFSINAAVQSTGADTCSNVPTVTLDMRCQVRDINDRLDVLADQMSMLGLQTSTSEDTRPEWSGRPQTSSLLSRGRFIVGRYRELNRIKDILKSSVQVVESSGNNRGFSVLPIVGEVGMGKTAIAGIVFDDDTVKKHFELRMWVRVSKGFDPILLLGDVIRCILKLRKTNEQYETTDLERETRDEQYEITDLKSMQQRLHWEVQGKSFLLVLNSVREVEPSKWEELFEPLHSCRKGSMVIVTSRNRSIGDRMQGWMCPVVLDRLSNDDLWRLLQSCTSVGSVDAAVPRQLEATGRCIVEKLQGSPLEALALAPLLQSRLDVEHWKSVLEHDVWECKQAILPALQLSYLYLNAHLKQCFAYCSLFPKGHTFDRYHLVQMWEAQCFVRTDGGPRMDMGGINHSFPSQGHRYFSRLLHWSLKAREVEYFMHDFEHDLATYASRDDCFRLENQKSTDVLDTVRHISVCLSECDTAKLNSLCRYEKLRSLLFLPRFEFTGLSTHVIDELLSKMKLLRVLGLSHCRLEALPESIGVLKHLRYLDLSGNHLLRELPKSLGNLYNLQILKLAGCRSLRALPDRTNELSSLRHLQADETLVRNIDGLGKLTSLEELKVRGGMLRELGGMCMLRKLWIQNLEEVESQEEVAHIRLHRMKHLEELILSWSTLRQSDSMPMNCELEEMVLQALRPNEDSIRQLYIVGYRGVKWPDWMGSLTVSSFPNLFQVSVKRCPNWKSLPSSLSQLPRLLILTLESMPQLEECRCAVWDGDQSNSDSEQDPSSAMAYFRLLHYLTIDDCPKLRELFLVPPTLKVLSLEKVGLARLPSVWARGCFGGESEAASSSASGLCLSGLTTLSISSCRNLTSVSELLMHRLSDLEVVKIKMCPNLASFPHWGFGHLVRLKKLEIIRCPRIECPARAWEEEEQVAHLPSSLEELKIEWCGDAMGCWWRIGLRQIGSLQKLSLRGSPTADRHQHSHIHS